MKRESANPGNLYRDPERGVLLGVCAGVADYFDWNLRAVRLLAVLSLIFFTVPTFLAYVLAAFVLKKKPKLLYRNELEAKFWRDVRRSPRDTFVQLRRKFSELDKRLQHMEAYVTSARFKFDNALHKDSRRT